MDSDLIYHQKHGTSLFSRVLVGIICFLSAPALQFVARPSGDAMSANAVAPAARAADEFSEDSVLGMAQRLAAAPYHPSPGITPGLAEISYDQYKQINFRRDHTFWDAEKLPFRLQLLPAGAVFKAPVTIYEVQDGKVRPLVASPDMFEYGHLIPEDLKKRPLSLSGFRILSRINSRDKWDEFLVFQGASYFRAVARGQTYGLSSRGLAIGTGEAPGEEFPAFTHFWIERPAGNADHVIIHALLDSPSTTGAYRFEVTPGSDTLVSVRFTLFPRVDLRSVGIAPLTSMFLFDDTNRSRFDDFRNRVHDSDGLMFELRNGEHVWRQLANPRNLQLSGFTSTAPSGFGLMQRAKLISDFQDLEANYERRPSAWVELPETTAEGSLRLIEIPTSSETNDNIVAFWQPTGVLPAGRPYRGTYTLHWTAESLLPIPVARIAAARSGRSFDGQRRLFVLDMTGTGTDPENVELEVTCSAGKVVNKVIQSNPSIRGLRASFELDTSGVPMSELRAVLHRDGKPISETWLYRWTPD